MRIVGGSFRGLKLAGFDVKGVRPTTDRVRESLFNIMAHDVTLRTVAGPFPAGSRVLDVFAGTGALGLEALSRGAAHVTFLENDPASMALLRENITRSRMRDQVRVLKADALNPGPCRGVSAGLVLMDPPYGEGRAERSLQQLHVTGWLEPGALAVVESDKRDAFDCPESFAEEQVRDYGRTRIRFLRHL